MYGRNLYKTRIVTNVSISDARKDIHTPSMPNHLERRIAQMVIATAPRITDPTIAGRLSSTAEK